MIQIPKSDDEMEEQATCKSQFKGPVIYNYCKKSGYLKTDCLELLRKNQNQGSGNVRNGISSDTTDYVFNAFYSSDSFKKIWIGDSGVSCHYYNSDKGLFEYTAISDLITVGNDNK